ncbi:CbrC family protein [Streptomyces sp. NPDC052309]|uniref:CbrC family protein n=1 Tax=Streptomyces sp. NPDC052309 TaxID=3155421 RepID=UPI003425618B
MYAVGELSSLLRPWCIAAELATVPDAWEELRSEVGAWGWSAEAVESYLGALDKDSQPTGYLFMCRACGWYMAYADST